MLFENDIRAAFGVITDLMNTSSLRSGTHDLLETPETINEVARANSLSYTPDHTNEEDIKVRLLRGRLEEFLRTAELGARLTLINGLLVSAGSIPQLAAHTGDELPHFHYTMDDASFVSKLTALAGMGLARLMTAQSEDRFRVCSGDGCDKVFIDVSKNASRRYCDSQTCGNRLHAARYRARRTNAAS